MKLVASLNSKEANPHVSRAWEEMKTVLNSYAPAPVPATAASSGIPNQWSYDTNFIYICVAPNTWKRVGIVSW